MCSNHKKGIKRRELIELLGLGTVSLYLDPVALAQSAPPVSRNKFMIYIHAGSWDGLASGLIQPHMTNSASVTSAAKWSKGLFVARQDGGSLNPNVNVTHNSGDLFFNNYTKTLLPIANQMCFTVGNPLALGHPTAAAFQTTGADEQIGQASWISGFAHMMSDGNQPSIMVGNPFHRALQMSATTPNVAIVEAASVAGFRDAFQDQLSVPRTDYAKSFWDVSKQIIDDSTYNFAFSKSFSQNYKLFLNNLVEGANNTGAIHQSIGAMLNRTEINRVIDTEITAANDGEGVKQFHFGGLTDALQLAGVLAKSGLAKAMSIGLHGDDWHFGYQEKNMGSTIGTARRGADMFVQLRLFWQWIQSQNLQDDVMVVISHDFTRTPYNTSLATAPQSVMFNNQPISMTVPGTDHHAAMSMIFINGKVPPASKIGGIGDNYTALPTADLKGLPVAGKAYTSSQLVGTMLLRCFGEIFKEEREMRRIWPRMGTLIDYALK